jgi:hypothetical protein
MGSGIRVRGFLNVVFSRCAYHAAGVSRRDFVDKCTSDVEVLAGTPVAFRVACATERSTGVDVVLVDESEAHVLLFSEHFARWFAKTLTDSRGIVSAPRRTEG